MTTTTSDASTQTEYPKWSGLSPLYDEKIRALVDLTETWWLLENICQADLDDVYSAAPLIVFDLYSTDVTALFGGSVQLTVARFLQLLLEGKVSNQKDAYNFLQNEFRENSEAFPFFSVLRCQFSTSDELLQHLIDCRASNPRYVDLAIAFHLAIAPSPFTCAPVAFTDVPRYMNMFTAVS